MKKTALTLVAMAFGTCVAFAQTAPEPQEKPAVNTEESVTVDKMSNTAVEAGRREVKIEELPANVQKTLKGEEFKTLTIVTIAEVQAQDAKQYEVSLANDAASEASVIVLIDEKGKVVSKNDATTEKIEE